MKLSNNRLTLLLMISSILLLLVLQFFWLRGSYEKAFLDLRRESNILFRNTVFSLRDSALIKNIETVPGDSGFTIKEKDIRTMPPDSVIKYFNLREKNSSIQVFITSDGTKSRDSITTVLKPMVNRFHMGKFSGKNSFIVRLGPDTINIDTAQYNYKIALTKGDIDLPFKIKLLKNNHSGLPRRDHFIEEGEPEEERPIRRNSFSDSLHTDFVRINPLHRYTASFGHVRGFILKAITPQILFSLFLTLITSAAFLLLYRSIRAQQRLMELKNDFISNMTHELKTPISTVSVALEALKNFKGIDNPKLTSEYLDIAQHELNRLTMLTDKVLKTSLLENHVEFIPETVDLESTTEQVLNAMRLVFEKQKATVAFEKNGSNFTIKGSEVHLTNVIYNLLDNALKYSFSSPSLLVTLESKVGKIIFSIKDNGIGIAPEFRSKIFEKFFRVPSGNVHNTKGYGLGLNYVHNVVKSHKGKIEVKSEEGKGSTFIITLPTGTITHG
ncbi:MAG TPA: HAMP domain-containing sensor histidine kinase [Cyclobacteriaceae bacterium]